MSTYLSKKSKLISTILLVGFILSPVIVGFIVSDSKAKLACACYFFGIVVMFSYFGVSNEKFEDISDELKQGLESAENFEKTKEGYFKASLILFFIGTILTFLSFQS